MQACPSKERLLLFLEGQCSDEDAEQLAAHVESCEPCSAFCGSSAGNGDLMAQIRGVLDMDSSSPVAGEGNLPSAEPGESSTQIELPEIEGYRILEELGRGGMGVVYKAWQESTRRHVALKVLLEGPFASQRSKRRFEREVELAARLDHPHVVAILDSGIARGHYYFAMRYVEGVPLNRFVAERRLSPRVTLELFHKICIAVSYAHQRGIIHRDLKPSNILVDPHGHPHVLDFGLARVVPGESEPRTGYLISTPGQPLGTLPYMSPEQTAGNPDDLDTRTDLYSLGVILYKLLAGRYPYPVHLSVREVLRNICEQEPQPPSRFNAALNGEVDAIVLKTLAKQPHRRYQSADALAADIDRYLTGRPIDARRDSTVYVVRKLLWRHRLPVSIAAALLILVSTAGLALYRERQSRILAQAKDLLARFDHDPAAAAGIAAASALPIQQRLRSALIEHVVSPARTQRVLGARGTALLDPRSLWAAVDGGRLWHNGEWLEVCELDAGTDLLLGDALSVASSGSAMQRYVAWCLAGCLVGQIPAHDRSAWLEAAKTQVSSANAHPAVLSAARWAVRRMGSQLELPQSDTVFADDLTGLSFVLIPPAREFTRGSEPDDPDRWSDETPPEHSVSLGPLWMAQTELTWPPLLDFLDDDAGRNVYDQRSLQDLESMIETYGGDDLAEAAAGMISLDAARALTTWLSERGAVAQPPRRYRLPSEEEWEYACGSGNPSRFCFGFDARYARHFANCDANSSDWHRVGRQMPNWFGLHDMHGGLWEWTDSRYPPDLLDDASLRDRTLWIQKGGAFHSPAVRCRRAQRNFAEANRAHAYVGVRLVMELIE